MPHTCRVRISIRKHKFYFKSEADNCFETFSDRRQLEQLQKHLLLRPWAISKRKSQLSSNHTSQQQQNRSIPKPDTRCTSLITLTRLYTQSRVFDQEQWRKVEFNELQLKCKSDQSLNQISFFNNLWSISRSGRVGSTQTWSIFWVDILRMYLNLYF